MRTRLVWITWIGRVKSFSIPLLIVLGVGVGMSSAIFNTSYQLLLRPLPFPNASRLVVVWGSVRGVSDRTFLKLRDAESIGQSLHSFEDVTFYSIPRRMVLLSGVRPAESVRVAAVSDNTLGLLGASPMPGRMFTAEESNSGAPVALVSNQLSRRLAGDSGGMPTEAVIDGMPLKVIGVLPEHFVLGLYDADVLIPLRTLGARTPDPLQQRVATLGLLRTTVTIDQLRTELLRTRQASSGDNNLELLAIPLVENALGYLKPLFAVLVFGAALMLFSSVGNATALLLIRAISRRAELAIRFALGATRRHIAVLILKESTSLAIATLFIAAAVGYATTRLLVRILPADIPRVNQLRFDNMAIVITAAVAFICMAATLLLSSSAFLRQQSSVNIRPRGTSRGRAERRLQQALVITEMSITLVVVFGALLITKGLYNLSREYPGFEGRNVVSGRFFFSNNASTTAADTVAFYRRALDSLGEKYGGNDVCITSALPFTGAANLDTVLHPQIGPEPTMASTASISPACFSVLHVETMRGRAFTSADVSTSLPVVIVNRFFANRHFGTADPIGQQIIATRNVFGTPATQALVIVGEVNDIRQWSLEDLGQEQVYYPFLQAPSRAMYFAVGTSSRPSLGSLGVESIAKSIDPRVAVYGTRPLQERIEDTLGYRRLAASVAGLFAICSIFLAGFGLYATISFFVARGTRECGIRQAMGATPARLARDVLSLASRLGILGGVVGVFLLAFARNALSRAVVLSAGRNDVFYRATGHDSWMLIVVILGLCVVSLLSAAVPALRAAAVDPMHSLRAE